jgi:hypothetical protein
LEGGFPANLIAATFKLSDCGSFKVYKFVVHFLAQQGAFIEHETSGYLTMG